MVLLIAYIYVYVLQGKNTENKNKNFIELAIAQNINVKNIIIQLFFRIFVPNKSSLIFYMQIKLT